MKISKKIFSFFSTVNQYFPHIPYVASKKEPLPTQTGKEMFPIEKSIPLCTMQKELNDCDIMVILL
jgi:hypothetical protein